MTTAHPHLRVLWAGLFLIVAAFTASAQEFRGSLAGNPLVTGPTSNGNLAPFRSNGATGANQAEYAASFCRLTRAAN